MTEFVKGDQVKIKGTEFGGIVMWINQSGARAEIDPELGGTLNIDGVPVEWLELAEPHSWPPRVGDIWETPDGTEWAAMQNSADGVSLIALNNPLKFTKVVRDFESLKPVLVRRKGVN